MTHPLCSDDNCPCFAAGEQSMFDQVASEVADVVIAIDTLRSTLTEHTSLAVRAAEVSL